MDLYRDPLPEGAIARLGTVRLYHGGEVWRLLYAPDGKTVISAGGTETIRFWDVNSGKVVRQFVAPQGKVPDGQRIAVSSIALSSDGKTLAAATSNRAIPSGAIYLWDIASGKLLHASPGDQGKPVYSLSFSHNDKLLASGHHLEIGSEVRLWAVSTGKELRRLPVKVNNLHRADFSPVRDTLAVTGGATIFIVDAVDGKVLHKLEGHCNVIIDIAFSRDGKTLVSTEAGRHMNDSEYFVRLWDVETGKQLRKLGHQHFVWAVAFGTDGMLAATSQGSSDDIRFWDSQSGKQLRRFSGPPLYDVRLLAFSPDGKTLAYANNKGVIGFCDVGSATQVRRMPRHQSGLRSIALSPDGRTFATASDDRSVGLWDVSSAKELRNLKGHTESVRFVAFSPNGKFLASAANNHRAYAHNYEVILWDRATGKEIRRFKGCCLAFAPDGRQIACGGFDENSHGVPPGIISLHDVETGKLIRRFRGHELGVQNIAFSPDGKTLASASSGYLVPGIENAPIEDFTPRLWDVASGRERCHLERCRISSRRWYIHPSNLTFSPDGRLLVADAVEGSNRMDVEGSDRLNVWEVATGKKRRVVDLKKTVFANTVLFLSDCRTLAVGNSRAEIAFLDLATGEELGQIRGHSGAVNCLALSADAKTLISGSADMTALAWDLASVITPPRNGLARLPQGSVETLWEDLASADAAKADRAIWALITYPEASISFLKRHLQPAIHTEAERIDKLIADLDSDSFDLREKASRELEKLGEVAGSGISKAVANKPPLEVRRRLEPLLAKIERQELSSAMLRQVRAMEVLEHIATPEARDFLKKLAAGAPEARMTQEAKASLERLKRRAEEAPRALKRN